MKLPGHVYSKEDLPDEIIAVYRGPAGIQHPEDPHKDHSLY
jgi:hypothetical protein